MSSVLAFRLRNARLRCGLSLQQVADQVGLSKQMVNKYEQGKSIPSSGTLISLARVLKVNLDQLFRNPVYEIGDINFRKKSTLKGKRVQALKEEIRTHIENYLLIEDLLDISHSFKNPLNNIRLNSPMDVRRAAQLLKEAWEIGHDAIYNAVDLLEEKHIKVIEINEPIGEFDGLATWINGKFPIIVLSGNVVVERKRFTLFHELAHILLPLGQLNEKEDEKFCNEFASEMLLSHRNIEMELGEGKRGILVEEIKNLQEKYGISFPAIIYKLGESGFLSKNQIKEFFIRLKSDRSFQEMVNKSRFSGSEHSNRYENLVLRALSLEIISHSKASNLLGIPLNELNSQLFQTI